MPGDSSGDASGTSPEPSTDVEAPAAKDVTDYGDPAESTPEVDPPGGSSGAEEGISPLSPEQYETDPQGPTTSTDD
jgi:hypothetical protein